MSRGWFRRVLYKRYLLYIMPAQAVSVAATDVSIVALGAVIAIIIIIVVCVTFITRSLHGIINQAGKNTAPPYECTAWLTARQQAREGNGLAVKLH